jgi:hypothetical protein
MHGAYAAHDCLLLRVDRLRHEHTGSVVCHLQDHHLREP